MDQEQLTPDPLEGALDSIDRAWDGSTRQGGTFHSVAGDCLLVYNEGIPHYRERVDNTLTVFRALVGGRIVGLQLKELSQLPCDHMSISVTTKDGLPRQDVVTLLLLNLQKESTQGLNADSARMYAEALEAVAWSCGNHEHAPDVGKEAKAETATA